MAWNKNNPSNDELLTNFPAQCRANWEALELLTDAALKVTDAKVADTAGIVDTKLAQITTPSKVSGTALTLLPNVPSAAGVLPDANSPHKLKADSLDTTPQYLDGLIDTGVFQISAGDLLQLKDGGVATEKLQGGAASPGNYKFYGTGATGTKGFYSLIEAMITDLDHDAQKIKAKPVDAPVAGDDGKFLAYNHTGSKYEHKAGGIDALTTEYDTEESTTSGSPEDCAGGSGTLVLSVDSNVFFIAQANMKCESGGNYLRVDVDGTDICQMNIANSADYSNRPPIKTDVLALSAGSYTVKWQKNCVGGTGYSKDKKLLAIAIPS